MLPLVSFPLAFQKSVVRLLFQDPSFLDLMLEHLSPAFFENPIQRWFVHRIFHLRKTLGARSTVVALEVEIQKAGNDKTLVPEELPKYREFLSRIEKPVIDAPYVKDEITNFVKRQKLRNALIKGAELFDANRPSAEIDTILVNAAMFTAQLYGQATFIGPDLKDRIKRRAMKINAVPTDIESLDEQFVHKGLPQAFLGCIIAPTGRGKTKFLCYLGAAALRRGKKVLHITLEEPKDSILANYDAAMSGISLGKLKKKPKSLKLAWAALGDAGKNLAVYEDLPGSTVNTIRNHLRELETEGFIPDLLLIDYADEMMPAQVVRDDANSYTLMGQVYSELNALLKEKRLPGWTATQGTRGSLAKDSLDLDDIGDSWNKAKKAFIVLALCQTPAERAAKRMRIAVLKNRDGYTGKKVNVKVDMAHVSFIDAGEAPDEEEDGKKEKKKRSVKIAQPPRNKWGELLDGVGT